MVIYKAAENSLMFKWRTNFYWNVFRCLCLVYVLLLDNIYNIHISNEEKLLGLSKYLNEVYMVTNCYSFDKVINYTICK